MELRLSSQKARAGKLSLTIMTKLHRHSQSYAVGKRHWSQLPTVANIFWLNLTLRTSQRGSFIAIWVVPARFPTKPIGKQRPDFDKEGKNETNIKLKLLSLPESTYPFRNDSSLNNWLAPSLIPGGVPNYLPICDPPLYFCLVFRGGGGVSTHSLWKTDLSSFNHPSIAI